MAVNINVPSQVKTYANLAAFPATGALKTIYIAEDTNKTYRWTGSVYTEISASAAMTWGAIGGTLSNQTDLQNALDAKVPTSRTLTINGVTQDLSANRTFTISTGITIGSTAIASGSVGRILFEGAGNVVQQSSSLFWDATNNRLGIGTDTPAHTFQVYRNTSAGYLASFNSGATLNTNASLTIRIENANLPSIQGLSAGAGGFNTFAINPLGGNVLIGTTTDAGFKLDVNGTARVQGTTSITGSTSVLNVGDWTFRGASVYVRAASGGTENRGFFIGYGASTDGNGGSLTYNPGSNALNIRSPYNSGTIALSLEGNTNSVQFHNTSGTAVSKFFSGTGNLGIGTTTDAGFRLDVNGTARFYGGATAGAIFGSGTTVNLGSDAYMMATSASNNAGFLISRGAVGQYASLDFVTAASTSTGWSMQMRPNATRLDFVDRIGGENIAMSLFPTTRNVAIGTTTDVASSLLTLQSTTKGFLPPRMTTTQKNAIATPAAGLMVYDTTLNVISYYNGSMWI